MAHGAGVGVTSAEALDKLAGDLRRRNLRVALAHVHAPVGDMLRRAEVAADGGGLREFPNLDSAARWAASGAVPDPRAGQGSPAPSSPWSSPPRPSPSSPSAERHGGGSM
jgi:hypothetical protein